MKKLLLKTLIWFQTKTETAINMLAASVHKGVHPKHELMKYHDFFVNNIAPNATVLDIGCGNGSVAADVARKAKKVVAVDLNEKNITFARTKFAASNIEYLVCDATTYNFTDTFDFIVLSNVLEHIEHRIEFLNKIKHLAPTILIRVPMLNRDWLTLYKKQLGMFYFSDVTHFTEYTIESFADEIKNAGLKIKSYTIQFGEIWAIVGI